MAKLAHDNRGTPEHPFGFVYFDGDEGRIGYRTPTDPGIFPDVFPVRGTPNLTPAQFAAVFHYLREQFPALVPT